METTTIKIYDKTKEKLDRFREYKNESYDEVLRKIIFIAEKLKNQPRLSRATVDAIEQARGRLKKGKFITESEARKRLGF